MDNGTIVLTVCGLYLAANLVMGLWPAWRSSLSVAGFVAADRSMGFVVLYFVLGASIFSSFAFLGAPGWAYSRGAAAFYILAYGAIGMVPFYFFGPRARRVGLRQGFVTQAEMLAWRFESPALSILLAVLSTAAFVPYLVLQMKGAGYILESISGGAVSAAWGAFITYAVVTIYVVASGVLGVGWTNVFQGIFMMITAWALGLYLPFKLYGGIGPMFEQITAAGRAELLVAPGLAADGAPWGWAAYSSAILVSALGFSMWPHIFMKAFAASSDRSLRLTLVMYPTFQIFLLPILLIGFAAVVAFPGIEPPDKVLPFLLTQVELSPWLVGLVCAGALAASMSTGDTLMHAAASIAVRDGYLPASGRKLGDRQERRLIQILIIVIAALSFYLAVASEVSLVALLLGAYGGVAQIFPVVFAAFYWPRATGKGALWGLIAGIAVNLLFLAHPHLGPLPGLHEGVYGLIANVVVLVIVSLASRPNETARVRAFVAA
jgi:solute:Na+ symporter, SSS family